MRNAIDVHGHFGIYDGGFDGLVDRLQGGGIDVVRRRAQDVGISLTIVSTLRAFMPFGGDVLRANEESCKATEQNPDICFWAVIDPAKPDTFRQAEELLVHPRCAGIKIHPTCHNYEIREHGERVFEFAAARGATVISHSGNHGSFPEDFVPFADRYPSVSLILAHLGNSEDGSLSRQVYTLKRARHDNIYVDTSSARSITGGLIEWAVGEVGAGRLLFGSDTPLYFAANQKARIEYAEIPEEAKEAILYGNAARLLRVIDKAT